MTDEVERFCERTGMTRSPKLRCKNGKLQQLWYKIGDKDITYKWTDIPTVPDDASDFEK